MSSDSEFVLISDVHLTELDVPEEEGWWEYKSPAAAQDVELVSFLESLERRRPDALARTTLICNGDTWDFDSVFSAPEGVEVPPWGLPFTMEGSVWKMRRLVRDHHHFVRGLSRFLSRGNRVIFVMGNHDRELWFPEVQEVLTEAVVAVAPVGTGEIVAENLMFESWFVHEPGVLYAEHGQQYDTTCAYRDVLHPVAPGDRKTPPEIEMSFGSVIGRRILARLGTFNPFNDESFIMSFSGYIRHFFDYYWPKHRLFRPYFAASFTTLFEMRRRRKRALAKPKDTGPLYEAYAKDKGVDHGFIAMLRRLSSPPLHDRLRQLMHELWLDRFFFFFVAIVALIAGIAAVETWTQALLLLAMLPLVTFVLRTMGRGSLALQERGRWGLVAEQIARQLAVPIIAFGHSHRPERRPLAGGGRYYNLGSWAPVLDADRESTLGRARRFLVVRPIADRRIYVAFERWADGESTPF